MKVKNLSLYNFRNYQQGYWNFSDGINIFYGNNGQGKTNLLEAIYFSALGFSHRTFLESDLINNEFNDMSVAVKVESKQLEKEIRIKKAGRRLQKEINIDKIKIKPRELIGELNISIFSPEDLQLVKSDPSLRRRFLDMQICQINKIYCHSLGRYNKIVKHRNMLLKQIREKKARENSLDIWDEQFSKEAAYIFEQRIKILEKVSLLSSEAYENIAGKNEQTESIYKRKENEGEAFIKAFNESFNYEWYKKQLQQRRNIDIERSNTGIGPHRDDIFFTIDNMSAKSFASQGQQRSFVLALKIAELNLIKDECGEYPVFLLDDVMSELDATRKQNLLEFLNGKVQTFITLTEKEIVQNVSGAMFFKVEKGNVFEEKYG